MIPETEAEPEGSSGKSYEIAYRSSVRKKTGALILFFAVLISLFLLNIAIGSSSIPLREVIAILLTGEGTGHNGMIVNLIRVPMALMAIAVGAALALGGCAIQTILRNPIASPYTLGISNAASFGAALGLITDANLLKLPETVLVTGNAFLFAFLASMMVYLFSTRRGAGQGAIILFGLALNFLFAAFTMILQYIADDEDLQSLVFWSMGSLLKTTWPKFLLVLAVLLVSVIILFKNAWKLTAMTLDEAKATSLGVNTKGIRRMAILLSSLLTAFAVSFVGTIGFVGIIAPHLARSLVGEDQRFLLPLSALIGAFVVSGSFLVSKIVIPGVILPIGLVTAILGIPLFMSMIFHKIRILSC